MSSKENRETEEVVPQDNTADITTDVKDASADNEDEKIEAVKFGEDLDDSEDDSEEEEKEDLSKYTVVDADHLDEDAPLPGQEYALFSFLSPEGIMNCNVRAVKFRGAFPSIEKAQEYCKKLEKKDKYFKIFLGESGKWLDFDPPASRVEKEMSSNKAHQKILDNQANHRMKQINELAGKYKKNVDKKDKGAKTRKDEIVKAGAADDMVEKQRSKKQEKLERQKEQMEKGSQRGRASKEALRERMRKNLAEKRKNKSKSKSKSKSNSDSSKEDLNKKIKVVGKASQNLEDAKDKAEVVDKNIQKIRDLMAARRNKN